MKEATTSDGFRSATARAAPPLSSSGLSRGPIGGHTRTAMAHDNARTYFVYILASKPRGTLYVGVTNSILTRVEQHRAGVGSAFTKHYRVHTLVWLELHGDITRAIQREKTIKHYMRDWKINLIEQDNPHWLDLYPTLPGAELKPGDPPR